MSAIPDVGGVEDNVIVTEWDADYLREVYPQWERYPHEWKRHLRRRHPEALVGYEETHNLVVDVYLEHLVDLVDGAQSVTTVEGTHLALGDDGTSPSSSDTILGNEVYREDVDGTTDNGDNITFTTTIGSGEANGNTIREVGLFNDPNANSGTMINHATLITPRDKNSSKELGFDVTLTFQSL